LSATPVQAVPTITFTTGPGVLNTTIGSPTFSQNFGTGANCFCVYTGGPSEVIGFPGVPGGTRLLGSGNSVPGLGIAPPVNGQDNYLAVLNNGFFQINFQTAMSALTFVLGDLDASNYVTLTYAGGGTQTLSGSQLTGGSALGSSGLVRYDFGLGPQITNVLFGNGARVGHPATAFELDSIVAAVPEPATWLMMILGFGLVGAGFRRRRGKGKLAAA
jgi:PEP-CTERM motif